MHVDAHRHKPRPLVDLDRALVEGRHREDEPFRPKAVTRKVEPGGEEGRPEAAAGEIGPQSEADLDRQLVLRLEREVADELARVVLHRPVRLAAERRFEKLLQIVDVC
jgi:hypothetical protein